MNVLKTLRIADENGALSLTNLALIASVIKTCAVPHITAAEIAFNLAALVSYQYKRWHNSKQTDTEAFESRIKGLETGLESCVSDKRVEAIENNLNLLKTAISMRK